MDTSMTDLLQNIKQSELQADVQRNELISVRKKIEDTKIETIKIKEKHIELKKVHDINLVDLIMLEFDAKHLEKTEDLLLTETLPEKKKNNESEKSVLENLRNDVWQKRKSFCDRAREFNDKNGFLAQKCIPTAKRKNPTTILPLPVDQGEFNLLSGEVVSLELQLNQLRLDQSDCNKRQLEAEKELERVTKEHDNSNNLIRDKKVLTCIQQQNERIKTQCITVQKDINYQEMLIKAGNQPGTLHPNYMCANKKTVPGQSYNNTKYVQSLSSVQNTASSDNFMSARDILRSSGRSEPTGNQLMPNTTYECRQGQRAHQSKTLKGEKGSCTSPIVRKPFVPKMPSLMTQRLLSSKKSSLALEETFMNISRQESAPIPSTEMSRHVLAKRVASLDKPPCAKRKAVDSGEDVKAHIAVRVIKPYIA